MKIRKLLGGLILSTVLAAGIGVSVGSQMSAREAYAAEVTNYNDAALYLDTSSCWKSGSDDERFAVYWSDGTENGWYSMIEIAANFYGARLPEKDISLVIFVRFPKNNPTNDWDYKWNQTDDLSVGDFSRTKAVFKVSAWDGAGKSDWKENSGYTTKFVTRYVACADNGWTSNDADYKMTLDMTKAELRLEKAFEITGSEKYEGLKLTDGTWNNSYGVQYVAEGTSSTYIDLSEGSNNNIRLLVDGTYEIYWKCLSTDNKNIWIQIGSDIEADSYAQAFLSSIKCNSDSTAFAIDVWNKVGSATTSMEYKFEQLTNGAKHLLQSANASQSESASNIEKCAARYDRILSKYGYGESGPYHDFMGRAPTISGNGAILLNSIVNGSTGTMIAIISISAVSLAAVGGYFLFRRKKEN